MAAHVYILRCSDGSLYTGATKDLSRRLEAHESGKGSRYTRSRLPVSLVYSARVRTWKLALREERRIKALTRAEKLVLVLSGTTETGGGEGSVPLASRSRRKE